MFYQQLLKERQTVGEALRKAKVMVKRKYYDTALGRPGETEGANQRVALVSWAGLVLYGNSTATIGQRLGAPAPIATPTALRGRER
jgi:CHAT domain-containing protein